MSKILAIESSCDDTSICILQDEKVLSLVTASQIDHQRFGGVFPELASRLHSEKISLLIIQACEQANVTLSQIDAFAATAGPGLIGSLHIGVMAAKTLAFRYQKPYIPVHHLAAHIEAARFVNPLVYPVLALLVSGGHTMLIEMDQPFSYHILGQTRDDAAGEAFDKVARMLDLPYPGGPLIDQIAQKGHPRYVLPTPLKDQALDFSFSGLKTSVHTILEHLKRSGETVVVEDMAFAVQETIVNTLFYKTTQAFAQKPYQTLVLAGGVASNQGLREKFTTWAKTSHIHLLIPPPWACTDNGAMIALVASSILHKGGQAPFDHKVLPNWSLTDFHFEV